MLTTMVPYLAQFVHVVYTIQVNTTFTLNYLNEWEFVIWYGSVERIESLQHVKMRLLTP
jgi:hypothetical protein